MAIPQKTFPENSDKSPQPRKTQKNRNFFRRPTAMIDGMRHEPINERSCGCSRDARRRGFTLVEVLLVVVIMAILAAVAVQAFNSSTDEAKDAVLLQNLATIRAAIERFKVNHDGKLPGFTGTGDLDAHMSQYTDRRGNISPIPDPDFPYGPYLDGAKLVNPFNGGDGAMLSSDPANETPDEGLMHVDGSVQTPIGWFYDPDTGRIAANAEGTNAAGVPRVKL